MKSLYVFLHCFFTVLTAYAVEKPVKVTGNIKGLGNNRGCSLYLLRMKKWHELKG